MKKLFAIGFLALLSTGCSSLKSYRGACYPNGMAYDNKQYSKIECTKYCSSAITGVCNDSIDALKKSENEARAEISRRHEDQLRVQQENRRKDDEAAKNYWENQLKQDKILCSSFGFANKSEGMANCMMLEQSKRDSAREANKENERMQMLQNQQYEYQKKLQLHRYIYAPESKRASPTQTTTKCKLAPYGQGEIRCTTR